MARGTDLKARKPRATLPKECGVCKFLSDRNVRVVDGVIEAKCLNGNLSSGCGKWLRQTQYCYGFRRGDPIDQYPEEKANAA